MGSTHRDTWKRRERQAAALFGARRNRCSGSSGRDDLSRSDSTHRQLFLEVKLRGESPFRRDFDEVREVRRGISPMGVNVAHVEADHAILVVFSGDLDAVLNPALPIRVYQWANRNPVRPLFQATEALAARENKTPVVLMATKGRPGFLVAFRLDQIEIIRRERWMALYGATGGQADHESGQGEAA